MAAEGLGDSVISMSRKLQLGAAFAVNDIGGRLTELYDDRDELVGRATDALDRGRRVVEGIQDFVDDTVKPIADAASPFLDNPIVGGSLEIAGGAMVAAVDAKRQGQPIGRGVVGAVGAGVVKTVIDSLHGNHNRVEDTES